MAQAAAELSGAILAGLPEPWDCQVEFSAGFERRMKRVIFRVDHPVQFRIIQRVASIFLVLFIGFATILAASPTVRAAVFGWIRERYESFTTYFFEGTIDAKNHSYSFSLGTVPDDYTYITTNETPSFTTVIYANSDNALYFTYTKDPSEGAVNVIHGDYTFQSTTVEGITYDLYLSRCEGDANGISWIDASTNTFFHISAFLESEELIKLAQEVIFENK